MTKILIPTENQEQRALVKWLSYHPVLRNFYLKLNNEGKRSEAQGWNLKLMGLRPGASDLLIFYPTNQFHGLFLEVKRNRKYTPAEKLSPTWEAQTKFLEMVKSVGYEGKVCYGFIDGKHIIEQYLLTRL